MNTDPTNPSPAEPAPVGSQPQQPQPLSLDDMRRGARANLDAANEELTAALTDKGKAADRVAKARKAQVEARSIAVKLGVATPSRTAKTKVGK